jgi:tape measure domain-containing protein
MADEQIRVDVILDPGGSDEALEAELTSAFKRIFAAGEAAGKKAMSNVGKAGANAFDKPTVGVKDFIKEAGRADRVVQTLTQRMEGLRNNSKNVMDIRSFSLVDDQLEKISRAADKAGVSLGNMSERQRKSLETTSMIAARAANIDLRAQRNITDLAIKQANERIVAAQQEGAKSIAATRAASQTRVAIIQGMFRQIQTIERGIGQAVQGVARTMVAAFAGAGNAIGRALGGLRSALGGRESAIASSMRRQEALLNASVSRQTAALDRLDRALSGGVLGAAAGRSRLSGALGLGGVLAGGAGLTSLLTSGFQRFGEIERLNKQFIALTGSAAQAAALMAEIKEFAGTTSFDLVGVADLAKGFLAMGTAAGEVLPMVQTIADAVALTGGSTDALVRIQRAIGQVVSAGRLQGDELNQLAENLPGLNIRQILADQLTGGNVQALVAMQEAGKITGDMFVTGLMTGLSSDPRLAGAAVQIGSTLTGRFANLKEQFADFGAVIIGQVAEPLAEAFKLIAVGLAQMSRFIKGDDLSPNLERMRDAIKGIGLALAGLLAIKTVVESFGLLRVGIAALLTPWGLLIAAITAAGAAFAVLMQTSEGFRNFVGQIQDQAGLMWKVVTGEESGLGLQSTNIGARIGLRIRSYYESVANAVRTGWEIVRDVVGGSDELDLLMAGRGLDTRTSGERVGDRIREVFRSIAVAISAGWRFVRDVVSGSSDEQQLLITLFDVDTRTTGQKVGDKIREVFQDIVNAARTGYAFIRDAIKGSSPFDGMFGPDGVDTRTSGEKFGDRVREIFTSITNALRTGWASVTSFMRPIIDGFKSFFDGFNIGDLAGLGGVAAAFAVGGPILGAIATGLLLLRSNVREGLGDVVSGVGDVLGRLKDTVADKLAEVFSGPNLVKVAKAVLNIVETVGKTLGKIATSPAFVGALAAVAAAALLVVARFGLGLAKGVASNVDDWARLIGDGLIKGLKAVFTGDLGLGGIAVGIVAALIGARALASYVTAGRKIGEAVQRGMASGPSNMTVGGAGLGGNITGFAQGIFGRSIVAAERDFARLEKAAVSKMGSISRIIAATGSDISTNFGTAMEGGLQRSSAALDGLISKYGAARVAGAGLRTGLGEMFSAFGRSAVGAGERMQRFTQGVQTAMIGLKAGGRQLAQSAGLTLASAVGAAFAGQMLAEADTMSEAVMGALSVVSSVAMGFATGGWIGGAVAGIAAIAGAVLNLGANADDVSGRIADLSSEIADLAGVDLTSALTDDVKATVEGTDASVQAALAAVGFTYDKFIAGIQSGLSFGEVVSESFSNLGPSFQAAMSAINAGTIDIDGLRSVLNATAEEMAGWDYGNFRPPAFLADLKDELAALGISTTDFIAVLQLISGETSVLEGAFDAATVKARLSGEEFSASGDAAEGAASQWRAIADAIEEVNRARQSDDGASVFDDDWFGFDATKQRQEFEDFVEEINAGIKVARGQFTAAMQKASTEEFVFEINAAVKQGREAARRLEAIKVNAQEARTALEELFGAGLPKTLQDTIDEFLIRLQEVDFKEAFKDIEINTPQFRQRANEEIDSIFTVLDGLIDEGTIKSVPELELNFGDWLGQTIAGMKADGLDQATIDAFTIYANARFGGYLNEADIPGLFEDGFRTTAITLPITMSAEIADLSLGEGTDRKSFTAAISTLMKEDGLTRVEQDFIALMDFHAGSIENETEFLAEIAALATALGIEISIDGVPINLLPGVVNFGMPRGPGGGGIGGRNFVAGRSFTPTGFTPTALGLPEKMEVELPVVVTPKITLGGKDKKGAGSAAGSLTGVGAALGASFAQGFANTAPLAAQAGAAVATSVGYGMIAAGGTVFSAGVALNTNALNGMRSISAAPVGLTLGLTYAVGVLGGAGSAANAGRALNNAARAGAAGGSLFGVGANLGGSMASGILSQAASVANAAASLVRNAVAAAQRAGKIKSPSRVFMEIGSQIGAGVEIGIRDSTRAVAAAATDMVNAAVQPVAQMASAGVAFNPVTSQTVENIVNASGGVATTTVSVNIEGNIYGDDALDQKLNAAFGALGRRVSQGQRSTVG